MSQLGDFLERLLGPEPLFQSVRAKITHSVDSSITSPNSQRHIYGKRKDIRKEDETKGLRKTRTSSIWFRTPAEARIEIESTGNDNGDCRIVSGFKTTTIHADGEVEIDDDSSGRASRGKDIRTYIDAAIDRHFNSQLIHEFIANLSLSSLGTTMTAGRNCVRIRARFRVGGRLWPHWLSNEADEFEFHGDIERGVLLKIIGLAQGLPIVVDEVNEVAFDELLSQALFAYQPSEKQNIRSAGRTEPITLDAAIDKMDFTILTPAWIPNPDRFTCDVHLHPKSRKKAQTTLHINYRGGEKSMFEWSLWITECDSPNKQDNDFEWEVIPSPNPDQSHLKISDPGDFNEEAMRIVSFQQEGTYVSITSSLPRDVLLDTAFSFSRTKHA
ncbi:hypothetical protein K2Y11_17950 [bacterium]|nr:hypothetical protein [bacterium]